MPSCGGDVEQEFRCLAVDDHHAVRWQEHDRVGAQAPAFLVLRRELQLEVAALLETESFQRVGEANFGELSGA